MIPSRKSSSRDKEAVVFSKQLSAYTSSNHQTAQNPDEPRVLHLRMLGIAERTISIQMDEPLPFQQRVGSSSLPGRAILKPIPILAPSVRSCRHNSILKSRFRHSSRTLLPQFGQTVSGCSSMLCFVFLTCSVSWPQISHRK